MRKEYAMGLCIFGALVTIFLAMAVGPRATVPISAPLPFGFGLIAAGLLSWAGWELWRYMSPQFQCNVGNWPVNLSKDIHQYPCGKEFTKNNSRDAVTFLFVGGIDYNVVNAKSTSEWPIFIFNSRYGKNVGKSFTSEGNFRKIPHKKISPYYLSILKREYPKRFKKSTAVYVAYTSRIDGSATPENQAIELDKEEISEQLNGKNKMIDSLFLDLDKKKKRMLPQFLQGEGFKEVE